MKKFILLAFAALFLYGCAGSNGTPRQGRIAVVEAISDRSTYPEENIRLTKYMAKITKDSFNSYVDVLTRKKIQPMLAPGEILEHCEGDCLVQLGKNIGADYVVQAFINRTEEGFAVTTEMYEVSTGHLVAEASSDVRTQGDIERGVFLSTAQMYTKFWNAVESAVSQEQAANP